eukprot:Clim_evm6s9 gene=Clim_evmTU6s9
MPVPGGSSVESVIQRYGGWMVAFNPSIKSCFVNLPLLVVETWIDSGGAQSFDGVMAFTVTRQRSSRAIPLSCAGGISSTKVRSSGTNDTATGGQGTLAWTQRPGSEGALDIGVIEVDPVYAKALGLADGDRVNLKLLNTGNVQKAAKAFVEPASADEWEMLELNAERAEMTILQQIRVVAVGDTFPVWLGKNSCVRLSVGRVQGLDGTDKSSGDGDLEKGATVLLGLETELIVAPKERQGSKKAETNKRNQHLPHRMTKQPLLRCCRSRFPMIQCAIIQSSVAHQCGFRSGDMVVVEPVLDYRGVAAVPASATMVGADPTVNGSSGTGNGVKLGGASTTEAGTNGPTGAGNAIGAVPGAIQPVDASAMIIKAAIQEGSSGAKDQQQLVKLQMSPVRVTLLVVSQLGTEQSTSEPSLETSFHSEIGVPAINTSESLPEFLNEGSVAFSDDVFAKLGLRLGVRVRLRLDQCSVPLKAVANDQEKSERNGNSWGQDLPVERLTVFTEAPKREHKALVHALVTSVNAMDTLSACAARLPLCYVGVQGILNGPDESQVKSEAKSGRQEGIPRHAIVMNLDGDGLTPVVLWAEEAEDFVSEEAAKARHEAFKQAVSEAQSRAHGHSLGTVTAFLPRNLSQVQIEVRSSKDNNLKDPFGFTGLLKQMRTHSQAIKRFPVPAANGAASVQEILAQTALHRAKQMDSLHVLLQRDNKALAQLQSCLRAVLLAQNRPFHGDDPSNATGGVGGLLITGGRGSGKTTAAETLCAEVSDRFGYAVISLRGAQIVAETKATTLRSILKATFNLMQSLEPALLFIDDLDLLAPSVDGPQGNQDPSAKKAVQALEMLRDGLTALRHGGVRVAFVATARSTHRLHTAVTAQSLLFGAGIMELQPPNVRTRQELTLAIAADLGVAVGGDLSATGSSDVEVQKLWTEYGRETEGFAAADLHVAIERSLRTCIQAHLEHASFIGGSSCQVPPAPPCSITEPGSCLCVKHLAQAASEVTPVSLRNLRLAEGGGVSLSDVGGLAEVKAKLKEVIEWPLVYSDLFSQCPMRLQTGLLLYGPPGCGKTMLASAIAKEFGIKMISVKGPELLDKYIGASEQGVRDIFAKAQAASPSVLFFDEFEALAPRRGHDSTGVTDRVVNQLLTQLDGVDGLKGVCVMAATSRPDLIDPALLRPGRLDCSVRVPMPNTAERENILRTVSQKLKLANGIDFAHLASATDLYSGADLQALMFTAQLKSVHEVVADEMSQMANGRESTTMSGDVNTTVDSAYRHFPSKGFSNGRKPNSQLLAQRILRNQQDAAVRGEEDKTDPGTGDGKDVAPGGKARVLVTMEHCLESLKESAPSLDESELRRLEAVYSAFEDNGAAGVAPKPGTRASLA